jgi:hypothetical protein
MKTALWLLLIELCVLLVLGGAITLVVQWRRSRRDRAAVARLVATVRAQMPERRAGARDLLARTGMLGQVLEDATGRIAGAEARLYEICANAYLGRDAVAVARLNEAVEAAIAPYRALRVAAPAEADVVVTQAVDDVAEAGIDPAEYQRLKDENQRLSVELQVTLDTMSRMLSEYSAMFAGGADAAIDRHKPREMFQADSPADGQQPPPASAEALDAVAEAAGPEAAAPPLFKDLPNDEADARHRLEYTDLAALDVEGELVDLDAPARDAHRDEGDRRADDPDLVELTAEQHRVVESR